MYLNLFLASLFLDASQIQILFPFLAKIFLQKIVLLLALLGMLIDVGKLSNIKIYFTTKLGKLLIFLVLWMFITLPFGVFPGNSFLFITQEYWKTFVVFLMVLAYVSSRQDFDKLVWVYILAVGLLGVVTFMNVGSSRMSINDDVFDANDTALQLLLALPFAFWKYSTSAGLKKIVTGVICLVILIVVIKTNSRGGFLGFVALAFITKRQYGQIVKGGLFKLIILAGVLISVVMLYGGDEYYNRISTLLNPTEDYNVSSTSGRMQIWARGLDMILNNPILGVGVLNFIAADGFLYADVGAHFQAAHNSYIQIGAELGIPGLILFVLIIWNSIKYTSRLSKKQNLTDKFYLNGYSIIGAWTVYVVCGTFLSAAYVSSFYFLLAMSMIYIRLESNTQDVKE